MRTARQKSAGLGVGSVSQDLKDVSLKTWTSPRATGFKEINI